MEGSGVSLSSRFTIPLWIRIGIASLFLVDTGLGIWKHFGRFEWVPWLCMGLALLLYRQRQRGETFSAYLKNPLAVASLGLFIAAVVGFGLNLVLLLAGGQ